MIAKFLKSVAIVATLAAGSFGPAQAESTMKIATATINDVQHEWIKLFVEELAVRAPGAVKTEIYPASQLGTIPRMTEGVLLGSIEAFTTPTSFITNVDPRFQAFDVPGLFSSPEDVHAALHDPAYRDHLETMFLNKGLRVIGAMYNSPTVLFTMKDAKTLEDVKGLKIRTFASPLQIKPMEQLGAIPLPLPLSEVIPQLQSGGLDGMLVGAPILTAFKYYDVGKYILDLHFSQVVSVTVVNEDWFQMQSEATKAAILAAGRAAEDKAYQWGIDNVARSYKIWTDNGGVITQLPEAEQKRMEEGFASLAADLLDSQPEVKAEYETLHKLVQDARAK